MQSIPFATRSYKNKSLVASAQNLINLYTQPLDPDAKNLVVLHKRPGRVGFGTTGQGANRGCHVMAGVHYVVSGNELYGGTSAGTYTLLGNIEGINLVGMADNGEQLVIVNGTATGYVYTVAGGLVTISDPDFKACYSVAYLHGYFAFEETGTGNWFISNLLDGTILDSVDTGTTYSHPDNCVSIQSNRKHLFVFGEKSIEIQAISTNPDFPFQRINEATVTTGTIARHSIQLINDTYYFLGTDKEFYRLSGGRAEIISDPNISNIVNLIDDVSDADGGVYEKGGHKFYIVSFRSGNRTLVYDVLTSAWHEWASFENGYVAYNGRGFCFAFGKRLVADPRNGAIYELRDDTYSDNGEVLRWEATSPPIHNNNEWMRISRFFLEFESGVGLTSGQGVDPVVMMTYSDDGGKTYSNERWRKLGKLGVYKKYGADWRRMKRFKQRSFRVAGTDPVKTAILGAFMDAA
ncbi:hypothetical protein KAR91_12835 [Candidatus Pacearchaeota archaeon]|nr:hypothetical protein [Candidatus Pacearchaeota archaeon]